MILNHMVHYSDAALDVVFAALADPTRRAVLTALSEGSQPVTGLANPHPMSLTGFMKHLRVLEDAGLIERSKDGRVVHCTLSAEPLQEAAVWLSRYQQFWTKRLDSLARYLYEQEELSPSTPHSSSAPRSPSPTATTRRRKKSGPTRRIRQR